MVVQAVKVKVITKVKQMVLQDLLEHIQQVEVVQVRMVVIGGKMSLMLL